MGTPIEISYTISAGGWGDGKSICIWRHIGNESYKIARFTNPLAASHFINDFNWPVSERVLEALNTESEDVEKD